MPSSSGTRRSTAWRSRSSTRRSRSRRSRSDIAERLRYPERADDRQHPRADGRRPPCRLPRVPRPALERPRPDEGRHPLRPGGHARRVRRARDVDDLEVRAAAPSVRRREGRGSLRSARALSPGEIERLTRRFTLGAPADHRPAGGHPGAGHGDERADDGVDDGHVLDAARLRRAGDRHREADLDRRLRLPPRGDRRRRRDGASCAPASGSAGRSPSSAASSRASATSAAIAAHELHELGATVIAVSDVSGGIHSEDGLDVPALHAYAREHGSLEGCDAGRRLTNEELLELDCDILVLAAREDQVTGDNAAGRAGADDRRGRERPDLARGGRDPRASAGSRSCRTSSRTRAASPSRTSSGCRISAGSSGRATRSGRSSPRSSRTRSTASGTSAEDRQRDAPHGALVAGIREVSDALEARGIFP